MTIGASIANCCGYRAIHRTTFPLIASYNRKKANEVGSFSIQGGALHKLNVVLCIH